MEEISPPRPLSCTLYKCDNKFHTDAIREQLIDDTRYGFIIIDGSCTTFHLLQGDTKTTIYKKEINMLTKHGHGGQSQNRFARLRDEQHNRYTSEISETATKHFIDPRTNKVNVKHLVVSGSASTKHELIKKLDMRVRKSVVRVYDVSGSGETGFKQTLSLCKDDLMACKFESEHVAISRFFSAVAEDRGLFAYSPEHTVSALESGAVDVLLVWSELKIVRFVLSKPSLVDEEHVVFALPDAMEEVLERANDVDSGWEVSSSVPLFDWLLENYRNFGSGIEIISGNRNAESVRFVKGFGGIGALLRYPVMESKDCDEAC